MLLAKGTGYAQFSSTVILLNFFLIQAGVVRFKKVTSGATLVSCPLKRVIFLVNLPAITDYILINIALKIGVLRILSYSPPFSKAKKKCCKYSRCLKSFYVNPLGIALPRFKSHTTTSYS